MHLSNKAISTAVNPTPSPGKNLAPSRPAPLIAPLIADFFPGVPVLPAIVLTILVESPAEPPPDIPPRGFGMRGAVATIPPAVAASSVPIISAMHCFTQAGANVPELI
ncbi:MAG: hypothetical protein O7D86_05010 [Proteobacteria bacterium]|nr:hypothetical protein [Pseudomonadota bacterium]